MIIGIKDILKMFGIAVVAFCAVFVSTFFLNFYLDLSAMDVESLLEANGTLRELYKAQRALAGFCSGISGGFLAVIAVVMLVFYIRLYINSHMVQLGTLKAMGYSNGEIALRFWVFGLSVLMGACVGYGIGHAVMPLIYQNMQIEGLPTVEIHFHAGLFVCLTVVPTVVYSALSCLFAYFSLKRPVGELLRGRTDNIKVKLDKTSKERSFLRDTFVKSVSTKKLLVFFVALGAFCFSAMVQMSFSMRDMTEASMAAIVMGVGVVLAVSSMFMAITSLVNANAENISIMKAFGYSTWECALIVFGGYVPFAYLGFAVGTGYQFGLMTVMVNLIFDDVAAIGYSFDFGLMLIVLGAFTVFLVVVLGVYLLRLNKISIKQTADE